MAIRKAEPLSRYDVLKVWRERRQAGAERSQQQFETARSSMVNHINNTASGMVQLSELMLRNKGKVDKTG